MSNRRVMRSAFHVDMGKWELCIEEAYEGHARLVLPSRLLDWHDSTVSIDLDPERLPEVIRALRAIAHPAHDDELESKP